MHHFRTISATVMEKKNREKTCSATLRATQTISVVRTREIHCSHFVYQCAWASVFVFVSFYNLTGNYYDSLSIFPVRWMYFLFFEINKMCLRSLSQMKTWFSDVFSPFSAKNCSFLASFLAELIESVMYWMMLRTQN